MVDRCVCCGETVPEGRQVCYICEDKTVQFAQRRLDESTENGTIADVNYWKGYIDGCRRILREQPKEND